MRRIAPRWRSASPMRTREPISRSRNSRCTTPSLVELAKRADNVPLGALAPPKPANNSGNAPPAQQYDALRSPDYARVLDRYVARLVSLKRTRDALAIYRREIDRNPSDPGLYDTHGRVPRTE